MLAQYPFQLAPLPYDYIALVPHCDPDTLYVHYDKIYSQDLQTLNYLLTQYPTYQSWSLMQLITGKINLPTTVVNNIKYYAGSVYAHELFFCTLCGSPTPPSGRLAKQIDNSYGSLSNLQDIVKQAALNVLGAGWVWLIAEQDGSLHIIITQNYEIPRISNSVCIFALDVWEHAYFLPYPADISAYINNWFSVLDWNKAEKNYLKAIQSPSA